MTSPIGRGVALALAAACAFGITTPVVAWASRDTGPFDIAALLYVGAAVAALALKRGRRRIARTDAASTRPPTEAPLRRSDAPRVVLVALAGGAVAPVAFAWGIARTGATSGALLLNLEAVFTVAFAYVAFREPIGRRVALAAAAMVLGGVASGFELWRDPTWSVAGSLAVAGATAAWALDNTLTRPLAERDPLDVVAAKGALGATLTAIVALVVGEPLPTAGSAAALLACGATGYGLSLRLYLLAQRRIGAARTGSVFALAPFVGAILGYAAGDRGAGWFTLGAAALFGTGVVLHVTEHHGHPHIHPPVEHEHAHRHDDGHHTHAHDPPFVGQHSHPHRHDEVEHAHDHAPDLHHDHVH